MNRVYREPFYPGPMLGIVHDVCDCDLAARTIHDHLVDRPSFVLISPDDKLHMVAGHVQLPRDAMSWLVGCYNKNADRFDIYDDVLHFIKIRRGAVL